MPKIIESQAKASLDKSVEQLDENIESKLAQIRLNALSSQTKSQLISGWAFERKSLVSAFSVVVLVFLFASDFISTEVSTKAEPLLTQNELTQHGLTQNELAEDPELLDDLEFIYWLSQEYEDV